jgi:hypothetical protein
MKFLAVNRSLAQDSRVPANTLAEPGGHDSNRTPNTIVATPGFSFSLSVMAIRGTTMAPGGR